MASLADAIHTFQNGGLSRNAFLDRVEELLSTGEQDVQALFAMLRQAESQQRLPGDLYIELQRRIGRHAARRSAGADRGSSLQTRVAAPRSVVGADQDSWDGAQAAPEGERIKGVGDILNGRFVLEECIGFGGMGTVYKALDLRKLEASDRKPYIAIKVLNVHFRGHPQSLITLQREAKKAQELAHPNIVTVYDFDRDGTTVYLTMEYLSGRPLSRVLREPGFSGLPYAEVVRIVGGIVKGLAYAHERGFVHCDLKPANVFLSERGEVKVIDFGIARAFHKPENDSEATVFDPGSLGGLTPAYASPEMLERLEPDPRDDIYALACIAYELLCGRHPFDRLPALQARHAGMKPQRPRNLGLRPWRALKAALAFERERRTPTAEAFLRGFRGERSGVEYLGYAAGVAVLLVALGVTLKTWHGRATPASQPQPAPTEAAAPAAPLPAQASTAPASSVPAPVSTAPTIVPALTMASVIPVLGEVPCSALLPELHGNALRVRGFLAQRYGEARLREKLAAIPGAQSVDLNVETIDDDKCALMAALGPYWVRSRQAGNAVNVRIRAAGGALTEGDRLVLDITTPAWDSQVYLDYYELDGNVLHMVPSPRAPQNGAPAGHAATVGNAGGWVISKPFGKEMIVLLTVPAPLFAGMRAEQEPAATYLATLEKQLAQMRSRYGPDKVGVDFVQLRTAAKGR
ncbi:serine/threonine-protein kinase [Noviherbaspirillum pedocola]|uniref:Protein kinase n=1 Tax=Noviherbaspirillum pedocola TaxID=2801341 RepID=A0A934STT4_9BURK|nr:serine/threonine-protein kinase [Noviherbaspirillum pedocola]MBK4735320.1 protein kinase [Noviherbaspirillum pedocola]